VVISCTGWLGINISCLPPLMAKFTACWKLVNGYYFTIPRVD
jgi:hypothetical protein